VTHNSTLSSTTPRNYSHSPTFTESAQLSLSTSRCHSQWPTVRLTARLRLSLPSSLNHSFFPSWFPLSTPFSLYIFLRGTHHSFYQQFILAIALHLTFLSITHFRLILSTTHFPTFPLFSLPPTLSQFFSLSSFNFSQQVHLHFLDPTSSFYQPKFSVTFPFWQEIFMKNSLLKYPPFPKKE